MRGKIINYFKKNWPLLVILVDKHLRLIGQETSSQGVFIGPLFYYLQIPFGILLGIAWNFNLALAILTPLVLVVQIVSKKKIKVRYLFFGLAAFLIAFSPFIIFELRHSFRQTKAIVSSLTTNFLFQSEDSRNHNYPCVSISYITSPGNNLGYRYFFWLKKMHVNQPDSGSPVYTIVFPHSLVDRIDENFSALGLILPEYQKYTQSKVDQSCSGENSNLVDVMFGYTE